MLASAEGKTFHSKTFCMKNNFNHIHAWHFKVKVFQWATWQSRRVDTVRASLVVQAVGSLGWEDPLEEGMANPLQYSCLENPQGQRSLVGCSPWGRREWDMTEDRYSKHKKNRRKGRLYINCVFQEEELGLDVEMKHFYISIFLKDGPLSCVWCTGKTQRDGMEREAGGGIGMGNTCNSMADSCQCMTKTTTIL